MLNSRDFEKLCTPAKIYFSIAILTILMGIFSGFHFIAVLGKLVFAVLYTFVLSWLCKKGWKSLSWFLVLLPYVLILLTFFGLIDSQVKEGFVTRDTLITKGRMIKDKTRRLLQSMYGQEDLTRDQTQSKMKELKDNIMREIKEEMEAKKNVTIESYKKDLMKESNLSEDTRQKKIQELKKKINHHIRQDMDEYNNLTLEAIKVAVHENRKILNWPKNYYDIL